MMMGPAPMIRMLWMSVRFGMSGRRWRSPSGPSAFGDLATDRQSRRAQQRLEPSQHRLGEGFEQRPQVMRTGAGLRVPLEAEGRAVGARDALETAVKERAVRRNEVCRQARFVHRKTMVLAGDQDPSAGQLLP